MRKKWVMFTSVVVILATMGLFVFWRQPAESRSEVLVPVIVMRAEVVSQGVHVAWLEAPADSKIISGYAIERSRDHKDFAQIAHVEKDSLQYLDTEGHTGDRYRVTAQSDSRHYSPSEPITAAFPKPGDTVKFASLPSSHVLGFVTPNSLMGASQGQVSHLKSAFETAFARLDSAMTSGNFTEAASYLHALQGYQNESLLIFPTLSPAEKTSLAQACTDKAAAFETSLYLVPEHNQIDGMLVEAGCNAIQEAAR